MASKADTLLKTYREKRDFARSSEPSGDASHETAGNSFVVQKHDATTLHFDFRIELDGVLKSWAVTKGPSDNPGDKRLAVRVEDHPLDYGAFEGTIPKEEYGGGTVMLWDRGTWEPIGDPHEGLKNGDLKMRIHGERMKGEWVLVHMKGRDSKSGKSKRENWLLIKHRDDYAKDENPLTERFTRSVATGRDFDGIAKGLKAKKKTDLPEDAVWHSDSSKADRKDKPKSKPKAKSGSRGKTAGALPEYQSPQLATLVDDVPDGDGWAFEMKYDGYRCLAAISGGQVALYTRNGKDWTDTFKRLVEPLSHLTEGTALIDGEICAFDNKGRTDFATLRNNLSNGGDLVLFAFDLLHLDGEDLTEKPLEDRKDRLKELLGTIDRNAPLQYSEHVTGNGQRVFDAVCREGHEGIIAKRLDAPYRGDRNRKWLKIKCVHRQEFVIAGWSPSNRKKTFASLLVGTYDGESLRYRGRVGTGFSQDDAAELQKQLDARDRKTSPFDDVPKSIARNAKWVTPELVCEIGFTEFTEDGYLRHPSFLGLREDKPAKEVVIEKAAGGEQNKKTDDSPASGDKPHAESGAGVDAAEKAGVRLTSPDRVVFPHQGLTKSALVAYYEAVAERMLPHIANRPLSLLRCPQGRAKYCFFQKHDTGGFPKQLKSVEIEEKDGEREQYFYLDDFAGLVAGVQMNVLEWHIWGSRIDSIEKPDRLIFDIDPDEGLDFEDVRSAARDIRQGLQDDGLESFAMVTGGKGIHVIAPLTARTEWPEVKAYAKQFAARMEAEEPKRFTANMSKAKRKGRIFIDYLRNERGSTAISPFSVRSREGAPVAVPIAWDELNDLKAANVFDPDAAMARAAEADPWADYDKPRQSVTKKMLGKG
ncbi:ATP-dependent DNA ligase [Devosia pacifica]|uniref:DNA ligase (ATP) n=1 Tax=Devosia pacifica TaxID=1335967 RepID=A0A918VV18_9HYPH|nr:DNA ligase D [Devosia pacifica]GHA26905.1 ATP-dependent DNA ligase [Devosia pacifica]